MAFANRLNCYVCDRNYNVRQMTRLVGEQNEGVRDIAAVRRQAAGLPPVDVEDNSRVCFNCYRIIVVDLRELENNPHCLHLNVISPLSHQRCIICNAGQNIYRMSLDCRVNVYVSRDIFIPEDARLCLQHLGENGFLLNELLDGLTFVNRPYVAKSFQQFLQGLRKAARNNTSRVEDINRHSDQDFKYLTSLSKQQFEELTEYCLPIENWGNQRNISQKHLLTFLVKMRHSVPDGLLKIMFGYPSRQTTSSIISNVRQSLTQNFVPNNIGIGSITRDEYIRRHVTEFANKLYNRNPNEPKAIVYIDCTYNETYKSSNFRVLRQSYCYHKKGHLLKPEIIVAPDGYILSITGPYFSDSRNNDASILNHELNTNLNGVRNWFQEQDILIVDRGYRDSIPLFEELGLNFYMPPFLARGQRQFSTQDANMARLVTSTRWIVEARNGHLKLIFKFLSSITSMPHVPHLDDFYRIAGALINRFHPLIQLPGGVDLATDILEKSQEDVNVMQARVEIENLRGRNGQWVLLNHRHTPLFPRLTLEYLQKLTGIYHIHLAASYIQDTLERENANILEYDQMNEEPNFLRFRVFSRFQNNTKHMLWVAFSDENFEVEQPPIFEYYCTCKSGARTLGTCAHVACVLWFLGYARHAQNISYPSITVLNKIIDAAGRMVPYEFEFGP